ncbi:MAG: Jag N-terminal domain-containing protein [Ezakiella sp.]|nr:Jag N-terminal domain-containing protein [Ezakiella sp.]MDD7472156.1 Jag N-terminal domain-containing protein [Bacillota bacterium]MDY3923477.1 RNA-binding cell elongation regulator Jag/EloR [Ezakiella sp.]
MDKITLQKKTVEEAVLEGLKLLNAKREDVIIEVVEEGQKGFLGLIGSKDAKVTIVKKDSPEAINYTDNERESYTKNAATNILKEAGEKIVNAGNTVADTATVAAESAIESISDFAEDAKESIKDMAEAAAEKFEDLKEDTSEKVEDLGDTIGQKVEEVKSKFRKNNEELFVQFATPEEATENCKVFLEDLMHKMGYAGHVEIIPPVEEDENYVLDIVPDDFKMNSRFIGKKGDTLSAIGYLVNIYLRNHFTQNMIIEVDCGDYIYEKQEDLRSYARMAAKRALNEGEYTLRPMNAYDRRIIHKEINNIEGVTTHSEGEEPKRRIVVIRDPQ